MSETPASDTPAKMKLTIKTPATNYEVEVDDGASVAEVFSSFLRSFSSFFMLKFRFSVSLLCKICDSVIIGP